jgi:hypothetical protein
MNVKAVVCLFVLDVVWAAIQFYDIYFTVSLIYSNGIRMEC